MTMNGNLRTVGAVLLYGVWYPILVSDKYGDVILKKEGDFHLFSGIVASKEMYTLDDVIGFIKRIPVSACVCGGILLADSDIQLLTKSASSNTLYLEGESDAIEINFDQKVDIADYD